MRDSDRAPEFAQARNPQQLADAVIGFLRGSIGWTPTHLGSPDPETEQIADALVRINQLGFITDGSQPGMSNEHGIQRAWVDGFCDRDTADRIDRSLASSELVTFTIKTNRESFASLPVTRSSDGTPFTWAGRYYYPDFQGNYENGTTLDEWLRSSVFVTVIDPVWGRNDVLWPRLVEALAGRTL